VVSRGVPDIYYGVDKSREVYGKALKKQVQFTRKEKSSSEGGDYLILIHRFNNCCLYSSINFSIAAERNILKSNLPLSLTI
jgi:hypothetical protein